MSKVRVCFLGTPEFAVTSLQALIDDEHFEIVGVVTQPDRPAGRKMQLTPSPVKNLATAHGLRVIAQRRWLVMTAVVPVGAGLRWTPERSRQ